MPNAHNGTRAKENGDVPATHRALADRLQRASKDAATRSGLHGKREPVPARTLRLIDEAGALVVEVPEPRGKLPGVLRRGERVFVRGKNRTYTESSVNVVPE